MNRSNVPGPALPSGPNRLDGTHLKRLLLDAGAGLVVGVLAVTISTAFAALIFSGGLASSLSKGIALMLVASMVVGFVTAEFSSLRCTVARLQDSAAAILASVSAAIVSQMPLSATAEAKFITVVVAIALSSLLTGALFLSLGQLRLGNLIRFIPYPVIGGFLGGSALLLVFSAISLLVGGRGDGYALLYGLTQTGVWTRLLPGLLFALFLLITMRRRANALVIPCFLVASIVGFYVFMGFTNTSIAKAGEQGWLLQVSTTNLASLMQLPSRSLLAEVNWSAIGQQASSLVFVAIASTVAILLNATGMELEIGQDVNLNRDLKAAGVANIAAGLMGGMAGYHTVSQSVLVHKMGVNSRSIGLALAFVCGIVLLFGGQLLSYFPTVVLGGLLLFLGLSILARWVYDAWFKVPLAEYIIMIVIMVAINVVGILEGIGLGVVLGLVLFVVNYSRIDVVRHILDGNKFHSNVDRPLEHGKLLREEGGSLYILELQGFIFFGTAQRLLDMVRRRISDSSLQPLRFLLLDFRLVNGVDSTALLGFTRVTQLTRAQGITAVFTHLSPKLQRETNEVLTEHPDTLQVFSDLDHGVEWCENRIIGGVEGTGTGAPPSIMKQLLEALPDSAGINPLSYFEERDVQKGDYIITQGVDPGGLYFIENGQVTVELKDRGGTVIRLRTMQTGTVVGELGFYLRRKASASVVANEPCKLFFLSAAKLKEMEHASPDNAAAFHKFIIRMLSERLIETNETLQALMA
ncbi:MAG TPA: SulP family inorganic anion transporter [Candidatus Acidoferrales bacterium]|nr:SulP family inorganic anion transporter [Candidatus Acidoferrales bacterium]